MNINEEGKYDASMVRKFRTEYKSKTFMGSVKNKMKSQKKLFILWLNVPKVTAYEKLISPILHSKGFCSWFCSSLRDCRFPVQV